VAALGRSRKEVRMRALPRSIGSASGVMLALAVMLEMFDSGKPLTLGAAAVAISLALIGCEASANSARGGTTDAGKNA
jgi:hypothetical protein